MPDEYIHGRDPSEATRLETQAEFVGSVLLDRVEVPVEPGRVLDLGCGVGAMTRLLLERGAVRPVGLDRSLLQLDAAKRLTPRGAATWIAGDGTSLPFPDATFDLVYTSWFLEHVPEPGKVLAEAHRVLRPAGLVWTAEVENSSLLLWPDSAAFRATWDAFNRAQLDLHGDPFLGRKLFGYLRAAGFDPVDVFPHTFHAHAGKPEAFEAVVREFVEILKSGRANVLAKALVPAETYDEAIRFLAGLPEDPGGTFTYTFLRGWGMKRS